MQDCRVLPRCEPARVREGQSALRVTQRHEKSFGRAHLLRSVIWRWQNECRMIGDLQVGGNNEETNAKYFFFFPEEQVHADLFEGRNPDNFRACWLVKARATIS